MASFAGRWIVTLTLAFTVFSSSISGQLLPFPPPPGLLIEAVSEENLIKVAELSLPPLDTTYYFDQLIDHNDPTKGTFKQRYWHTQMYYKPGGPIILMNGGEGNAENSTWYLTDQTITGFTASKFGGSTVILEHRFFGKSNPVPNLNEDSLLNLHTIEQAIEDQVYFAKNVKLPQDNGDKLGPTKTPWILFGGSYPGALVSWTMVAHPDVFWIGYASSAVVQAQLDFWQYFLPIAENMPKNCSADISAVIQHIDEVFLTGTDETAKNQILSLFGYRDVVSLTGRLMSELWSWQDLQPYSGSGQEFFKFCDALEVKGGQTSPTGWGLDNALSAWAKRVNSGASSGITGGVGLFPPTPAPYRKRADIPVDDANRSWTWFTCKFLGYTQDGPPADVRPRLVSRIQTTTVARQSCLGLFPQTFTSANLDSVPDIEGFNQKFKGWNVKAKRLFFANGKQDPWREVTVSASTSPATSSDDQPIGLSNGFHCSDMVMEAGVADASIKKVQDQFINAAGVWLKQFSATV